MTAPRTTERKRRRHPGRRNRKSAASRPQSGQPAGAVVGARGFLEWGRLTRRATAPDSPPYASAWTARPVRTSRRVSCDPGQDVALAERLEPRFGEYEAHAVAPVGRVNGAVLHPDRDHPERDARGVDRVGRQYTPGRGCRPPRGGHGGLVPTPTGGRGALRDCSQ